MHNSSRAEVSILFKLSKGHKTSKYAIFMRINMNIAFWEEETSENSICH